MNWKEVPWITYALMALITAAMVAALGGVCNAAPTTGAATLVGSNNVTVAMSGAATACWFEWGLLPGSGMTWDTPNRTPNGGLCNYTIKGSPLSGNQKFYYRACDVTGCGADAFFTTATVTAIPTPTYGSTFENLTENGFDVTMVGTGVMAPYMWLVPSFEGLVWTLIFSALVIGIWLRSRDAGYTVHPGIYLLVCIGGLGLSILPEFAAIGQGIAYASIAGLILSIIKK